MVLPVLFCAVAFLALLDGCWAGWNRIMRPHPGLLGRYAVDAVDDLSERSSVVPRQLLQGVENGIYSPNLTAYNSAIVPLTLAKDQSSYYVVIQAGNTSFRVALDTASADLWIASSTCRTKACDTLPKYQLGYQSPTFVPVNLNQTAFNVSFADGTSAGGFVALETIQLSNLTVTNQAFGVVTDTNVTSADQVSGILGLGFPRLSKIFNTVVNATPFFATMSQRGQLDYPLFGLNLPRNSSGSLSFGAIDGSVVTNRSLIEWNEVVPFAPFGIESNTSSYLQWVIPLSSISVNGTAFAPQPTYPNVTSDFSLALLDVGTTGIYGPYQDVSRLYSLLPGSRLVDSGGQWALPCASSLPISFQFKDQNFTLQPTDYLIGPTAGDPNLCLSWPRALPPSSDGIDWQLGAAFLKTVYGIFSFGIDTKEPPMVGLYPRNNASAPVLSPDVVASFFSVASATVGTTVPNFPLVTPSFTTPPYALNSSVDAPPGEIVSSGLAISTYSPVLGTRRPNATAIPAVTPSPTLFTFILTDGSGHIVTSVSTAPVPSVTLGKPPGWTSGSVSSLSGLSCNLTVGLLFALLTIISTSHLIA